VPLTAADLRITAVVFGPAADEPLVERPLEVIAPLLHCGVD
jgi:hypothetical protein